MTVDARCQCARCKTLSAAIYRQFLEGVLTPSEDLATEITERWHEYEPYQRAVEERLPVHAVNEARHADQTKPALAKLLEWDNGEEAIAVLAGPRGTGKTLATVWFALHRRAADEPLFVRAHELAEDLADRESRKRTFKRVLEASMLIVDDLGKEAGWKFARDFERIVDDVYQSYKTLLITTNLTPPQFRKAYGESVADRIRERGTWIPVSGKSMRGGAR